MQTTDALGGVTTDSYDADGNRTLSISPRGGRTTTTYDALDRPLTRTDPAGDTTGWAYDGNGNLLRQTDAAGFTTTFAYDALDRRISTQDANGNRATVVYDAAGNVSTEINPLGWRTSYAYDALNRRTTTQTPVYVNAIQQVGASTATVVYDAAGNTIAVVDADLNRTTFTNDALNREVQQTDPLGANATFAYDAVGRLTSSTDRAGQRRNRSYDRDGRLTSETWLSASGGTDNLLTYSYDAVGNLLTAVDTHSAYTLTYDALNRVTSAAEMFNLTLTFSYDADGNRTRLGDSTGGVVTSTYDLADRLSYRESGGAAQAAIHVTLAWTARNQLASVTRYSGPSPSVLVGSADYAYDAAGQLQTLQPRNGSGTLLANTTYTYDAAGQLVTETANGSVVNDGYDPSGQLVVDNSGNYSYDLNGNRSYVPGGSSNLGPGNRPTQDNDGWQYSYDGNGNVISKSRGGYAWSYAYDERGQLLSAVERSGINVLAQASYTYDVFGNRLEADVDADGNGAGGVVVTRYVQDGWDVRRDAGGQVLQTVGTENWDVYADLNGGDALTVRYLRGDLVDQVFARQASSGSAWYLTDRLGSVRDLVDSGGVLRDHRDYSGFGMLTAETDPTCGDRYGFAGREYDAVTGWNNERGRNNYDPRTGRFNSEDPSGFNGGDPNLYRYAGNSPTNGTDPSGLESPGFGNGHYFGHNKPSAWEQSILDGVYWLFFGDPKTEAAKQAQAEQEALAKAKAAQQAQQLRPDLNAAMQQQPGPAQVLSQESLAYDRYLTILQILGEDGNPQRLAIVSDTVPNDAYYAYLRQQQDLHAAWYQRKVGSVPPPPLTSLDAVTPDQLKRRWDYERSWEEYWRSVKGAAPPMTAQAPAAVSGAFGPEANLATIKMFWDLEQSSASVKGWAEFPEHYVPLYKTAANVNDGLYYWDSDRARSAEALRRGGWNFFDDVQLGMLGVEGVGLGLKAYRGAQAAGCARTAVVEGGELLESKAAGTAGKAVAPQAGGLIRQNMRTGKWVLNGKEYESLEEAYKAAGGSAKIAPSGGKPPYHPNPNLSPTRVTPATYGLNAVADNERALALYNQSLRELAASKFPGGNAYQKYLQKLDEAARMGVPPEFTNTELLKAFDAVSENYLRGLRSNGLLGANEAANLHHWNFNKPDFPLQIADPRNLYLIKGTKAEVKALHEAIHQATSANSRYWNGPIHPDHVIPLEPQSPYTPSP